MGGGAGWSSFASHLHYPCHGLGRCFEGLGYPSSESGSHSADSSTPLTQTHLWRLGLLEGVPLGTLCDIPSLCIFQGPYLSSKGSLRGGWLAQRASSLTM